MDIKKDILWRVYLVYLFILIFAFAIVGKIVFIQLKEGPELLKKVQQQDLKYVDIDAVRGNIYANDESLLATSIPIFDIRMDVDCENISDKYFNEEIDSLAYCLSHLFNDKTPYKYKKELKKARENGNRYYLIRRKITYLELKKLRQFPIFRKGKYKGGLIVIPRTKRKMPFKNLARRTIGYENKENNIYVGLEGAFSEYLTGTDGKQLMRRIGNGDWKPVTDENSIEPKDGKDIVSSIDVNIQDVAENALHQHLIDHKAFQGCAILMEVETGYIKAIANLRYDSSSKIYRESYNYAISEKIEHGSTFKLASMMVILEDGKIKLTDTIDVGKGWIVYHNETLRDVHNIRDGKITVREAFEKSSNVGISKIIYTAYNDNPDDFVDYLYDIKLNEKLNINIQGERSPLIKHPKNREIWYGTTLPWMSVGYETLLTPLQVLTFYNAVANNGKMMKPQFVKRIKKAGKTIKTFEPEVRHKSICSQQTIDSLKSLLEGVVLRGTAQRLKSSIYQIAGKTGTAQIAEGNNGYGKAYNSSFVGYFPADNPKYSCIVTVNRPTAGRYYGSSVAAPVFKEIADKVYATQLNINMQKEDKNENTKLPFFTSGYTKDIETVISELNIEIDSGEINTEYAVTLPGENSAKLGQKIIKPGLVPNVKGMGVKDAVYLLESLGLKTIISGKGKVKYQSIEPGVSLKKFNAIKLELSI
ncbi:MAG: transpeptidase family protein [Bacteroidales bacterium]|nr:transpeptidase family protein [Bacteroidales bacterium]